VQFGIELYTLKFTWQAGIFIIQNR